MQRFAMLSTIDSLIGGNILSAITEKGIAPDALILDSKGIKSRDLDRHQERTGGRIPFVSFYTFDNQVIPTFLVRNHNSQECADVIASLNIDFLISGGTPRILQKWFLEVIPPILNCHPGLLPGFRGASAVEWALFLNEPVGNTVHIMSEGIDEGPILRTSKIEIDAGDSYQDVRVKVFTQGFNLLASVAFDLVRSNLDIHHAQVQDEGRYFRPIPPELFDAAIERLSARKYTGTAGQGQKLNPEIEKLNSQPRKP